MSLSMESDTKVMIFVFSVIVIAAGSFIAIITHDFSIDREELFFSIHRGDSCTELFSALEFENRKIVKDQPQITAIKHYIMEKNC